ncbi:MAG: type VI secretion system tip protein TssI/VgrG [Pirellulales bacterium]
MQNVHKITASGATEYLLWKASGTEELGRGFQYDVTLLSPTANIAPKDVLGKPLVMEVGAEGFPVRYFHGLVSRFERAGYQEPFHAYVATIRPWFWFLKHTADCRIFQQKTVKEILTDVFKTKNGFSDFRFQLSGTYEPRAYCVQYRESDFDFASRLMEEEGIYYYYEHTATKHTLVLIDMAASHNGVPELETKVRYNTSGESFGENEHLSKWQPAEELRTTKYVVQSYDFLKPAVNLEARAEIKPQHALNTFEWYDYTDSYLEVARGNQLSKVSAEGLQARQAMVTASGSSQRLAAGYKFKLQDHPDAAQNQEYLIVSTKIAIQSGEIAAFSTDTRNQFDVSLTAIASAKQYRSLPLTPRPVVPGPQTAVVVGKQGEEIWTDEHGRIKVQFPWDRVGQKNENSSCWIRVAQLWAGASWGAIEIPRIGQEVLVHFMEGDPDRPIVIGRVYNASLVPPYTLPANATQSGLKTRSSKSGTSQNFNELRFEDKKGAEEVYFHAEKDFNRVVENNDSLKVGFDKKDKGNQSIAIYNNRTVTIGTSGCEDGSLTTEIYKDESRTIKTGSLTTVIETDESRTIKTGNLSIKVSSGTCTIEAATKIELKVGGSTITMDGSSITIKSSSVTVQGESTADVKSPQTTVSGDGQLVLKGGVVSIN